MSKDTAGGGTPPHSAKALVADIERTRRELAETIDALLIKTDVRARMQHRAAEVTGDLRSRAHDTISKARDEARSATGKVAGDGPRAQATRGVLVYGGAAVAAATGALILAWLTVRRRRR